jgi:hypothetical protein
LVTVTNIDNQIAAIKRDPYFSWKDVDSGLTLYWASGMTQQKLSEAWTHACTRYEESAGKEPFMFICGDDNANLLGSADASSYDISQRSLFADCQFASIQMPEQEKNLIRSFHKGKRKGKGFCYFKKEEENPSGSPATLFINSVGTGILGANVQRTVDYLEKANVEITSEVYGGIIEEVGKAFGIEFTFNQTPVVGTLGEGVEFLKGVFVYDDSRFVWVPCESRLCKVGKAIVEGNFSDYKLATQMTGVANSLDPGVLGPLLRTWVDVWKDPNKSAKNDGWQNIVYEEWKEVSSHFEERALQVFCDRYEIDSGTYRRMLDEIKQHARSFGHFQGDCWQALSRRDYLGLV